MEVCREGLRDDGQLWGRLIPCSPRDEPKTGAEAVDTTLPAIEALRWGVEEEEEGSDERLRADADGG